MHPTDIWRPSIWSIEIYVDEKVQDYIVDLVMATREPEHYGVPGRGLIQLRRFAASHDQFDAGGQGQCFPARSWVCDTARRQGHGTGRSASSLGIHLRSRSGRQDIG